ncbi:unnamed protein product, partial [Discosporangium mesarthrocarpum]
ENPYPSTTYCLEKGEEEGGAEVDPHRKVARGRADDCLSLEQGSSGRAKILSQGFAELVLMVRSKPALRETVPEVGRVRFRYVFLAATAGALAAFSVPSSALLPSMSHPSVMRSTTFVKAGRRAGALSGWGIGARSGPAVGWQQRRRRRAEEVSVAEDMITTTSVSTEKGVATETGMGLNGQEESGVRQEEG